MSGCIGNSKESDGGISSQVISLLSCDFVSNNFLYSSKSKSPTSSSDKSPSSSSNKIEEISTSFGLESKLLSEFNDFESSNDHWTSKSESPIPINTDFHNMSICEMVADPSIQDQVKAELSMAIELSSRLEVLQSFGMVEDCDEKNNTQFSSANASRQFVERDISSATCDVQPLSNKVIDVEDVMSVSESWRSSQSSIVEYLCFLDNPASPSIDDANTLPVFVDKIDSDDENAHEPETGSRSHEALFDEILAKNGSSNCQDPLTNVTMNTEQEVSNSLACNIKDADYSLLILGPAIEVDHVLDKRGILEEKHDFIPASVHLNHNTQVDSTSDSINDEIEYDDDDAPNSLTCSLSDFIECHSFDDDLVQETSNRNFLGNLATDMKNNSVVIDADRACNNMNCNIVDNKRKPSLQTDHAREIMNRSLFDYVVGHSFQDDTMNVSFNASVILTPNKLNGCVENQSKQTRNTTDRSLFDFAMNLRLPDNAVSQRINDASAEQDCHVRRGTNRSDGDRNKHVTVEIKLNQHSQIDAQNEVASNSLNHSRENQIILAPEISSHIQVEKHCNKVITGDLLNYSHNQFDNKINLADSVHLGPDVINHCHGTQASASNHLGSDKLNHCQEYQTLGSNCVGSDAMNNNSQEDEMDMIQNMTIGGLEDRRNKLLELLKCCESDQDDFDPDVIECMEEKNKFDLVVPGNICSQEDADVPAKNIATSKCSQAPKDLISQNIAKSIFNITTSVCSVENNKSTSQNISTFICSGADKDEISQNITNFNCSQEDKKQMAQNNTSSMFSPVDKGKIYRNNATSICSLDDEDKMSQNMKPFICCPEDEGGMMKDITTSIVSREDKHTVVSIGKQEDKSTLTSIGSRDEKANTAHTYIGCGEDKNSASSSCSHEDKDGMAQNITPSICSEEDNDCMPQDITAFVRDREDKDNVMRNMTSVCSHEYKKEMSQSIIDYFRGQVDKDEITQNITNLICSRDDKYEMTQSITNTSPSQNITTSIFSDIVTICHEIDKNDITQYITMPNCSQEDKNKMMSQNIISSICSQEDKHGMAQDITNSNIIPEYKDEMSQNITTFSSEDESAHYSRTDPVELATAVVKIINLKDVVSRTPDKMKSHPMESESDLNSSRCDTSIEVMNCSSQEDMEDMQTCYTFNNSQDEEELFILTSVWPERDPNREYNSLSSSLATSKESIMDVDAPCGKNIDEERNKEPNNNLLSHDYFKQSVAAASPVKSIDSDKNINGKLKSTGDGFSTCIGSSNEIKFNSAIKDLFPFKMTVDKPIEASKLSCHSAAESNPNNSFQIPPVINQTISSIVSSSASVISSLSCSVPNVSSSMSADARSHIRSFKAPHAKPSAKACAKPFTVSDALYSAKQALKIVIATNAISGESTKKKSNSVVLSSFTVASQITDTASSVSNASVSVSTKPISSGQRATPSASKISPQNCANKITNGMISHSSDVVPAVKMSTSNSVSSTVKEGTFGTTSSAAIKTTMTTLGTGTSAIFKALMSVTKTSAAAKLSTSVTKVTTFTGTQSVSSTFKGPGPTISSTKVSVSTIEDVASTAKVSTSIRSLTSVSTPRVSSTFTGPGSKISFSTKVSVSAINNIASITKVATSTSCLSSVSSPIVSSTFKGSGSTISSSTKVSSLAIKDVVSSAKVATSTSCLTSVSTPIVSSTSKGSGSTISSSAKVSALAIKGDASSAKVPTSTSCLTSAVKASPTAVKVSPSAAGTTPQNKAAAGKVRRSSQCLYNPHMDYVEPKSLNELMSCRNHYSGNHTAQTNRNVLLKPDKAEKKGRFTDYKFKRSSKEDVDHLFGELLGGRLTDHGHDDVPFHAADVPNFAEKRTLAETLDKLMK